METTLPTPPSESEKQTYTFNAQTPPPEIEQRPKLRRRSRNSMPAAKRKRDERAVDERMSHLTLAPKWKRWILLPFRLMELPIELREQIYQYAMSNHDETDSTTTSDATISGANQRAIAIKFNHRCDNFGNPGDVIVSRVYPHVAALLGTSRQIRIECIPIFFRVNKFNFRAVLSLPRIINSMGSIARNNLQRLELCLWGVIERDTLLGNLLPLDRLPRLRQVELEFGLMAVRSMKVRLEMITDPRDRHLCTRHGGKTEAVRQAELRAISRLHNANNRVRITVAICSPLVPCHCHENMIESVTAAGNESQNTEAPSVSEDEDPQEIVRTKLHWEPHCMACSIVKGLEDFVDSAAYIKLVAGNVKKRIEVDANYCPPKISGLPETRAPELEQTAFKPSRLYPLLKSEKAIPKSTWISKSSRDSKGHPSKVVGISSPRD